MKRRHGMPFGAQLVPRAGTRFRLWAPTARRVDVVVHRGADRRSAPLTALADGWYEVTLADVGAGDGYHFRIDDDIDVPDPAARFNPDGVHGASEVIDPDAFEWRDGAWAGRPWHEAVIYELHVGAFSRAGTYAAIGPRLAALAATGITAIELMPVAAFAGERGWGYDGVLPYAPFAPYGRPEDLKALVQEAHACGLMMLLDVVYNHFGPEGNYLPRYARTFFTERHHTPWGAAIELEGDAGRIARDFFIHNALYWIEEYHFDGLRVDAVHAIHDRSPRHFVDELAERVQAGPGRDRPVHIVLENVRNEARYLRRDARGRVQRATAQWNDDFHHALHVVLTGERDGYYVDFASRPLDLLGRALAEGWAFQGEVSRYAGAPRGEPSRELPPTAFVNFLQTHDQVGNRACGERLSQLTRAEPLRAALAILLLVPHPPLLFMGEEYAARQPFLYFCDYAGELAAAVTAGRRREFARFEPFAHAEQRAHIPDPCAVGTFEASRLEWAERDEPAHREHLRFVSDLLALRAREIVPLVPRLTLGAARHRVGASGELVVTWPADDGAALVLQANLSDAEIVEPSAVVGAVIYATGDAREASADRMRPWEVRWHVSRAASSARSAAVPRATYRLQLNRTFTFRDAERIVPYLARLGISHLYVSPILKARPGSMHGYDVIDHGSINPELGRREDLESLVATLRRHGMGLVADIVPNHQGVMGADNAWWLDVLENGPAAEHASYFDIDWSAGRPAMRDRLLVPVLGGTYGAVLESGALELRFDAAAGAFAVHYFEHRFPIDPREYPRILAGHEAALASALGADEIHRADFESLLNAFGRLPARTDTAPEARAERYRDKDVHKRRLARLCERSPGIARHIAAVVTAMNGESGRQQSFDALDALLEAQAYRLSSWRVAMDEINYRRFFDINDLAALRVNESAVFDATHGFVFELIEAGLIDGLRIDHPDGLYDPRRYFERLQARFRAGDSADAKPLYVLVEKITAAHERLPEAWAVHGTTGYEFARLLGGWLVNGAAEGRLTRQYGEFTGRRLDFEEIAYQSKKLVMRVSLAAEVAVLAVQLDRIAQLDRHTADFTRAALRDAIVETIACFPVYRTYISADGASDEDRRIIHWAVSVASRRSRAADLSPFTFLESVLTGDPARPQAQREAMLEFTMKFQQVTPPVMAKGIEDTAFYVYNRLVALNEVGGDPKHFGVSTAAIHQENLERLRHWPDGLLATSTHDTKRGEDVRARIAVLTELPELWRRHLGRWSRLNRSKRRQLDGGPAPSRNDEYLIYQTLLGAWPLTDAEATSESFLERMQAYAVKAAREEKAETSWLNPHAQYEEALAAFVARLLERPERNAFLRDFTKLAELVAYFGFCNSLSQTLLKLTSPGVPDLYQGTELPALWLVDPDNRRAVDYDEHARLLDGLEEALCEPRARAVAADALMAAWRRGVAKLYVTACVLRLRARHAAAFARGGYEPLRVSGAHSEHVCAFARIGADLRCIVVAPRWYARLMRYEPAPPLGPARWGDTSIEWARGALGERFLELFSGGRIVSRADGDASSLRVGDVLSRFPVAVLTAVDE